MQSFEGRDQPLDLHVLGEVRRDRQRHVLGDVIAV
jgi:hypothetical protein